MAEVIGMVRTSGDHSNRDVPEGAGDVNAADGSRLALDLGVEAFSN